MNTTYRDAFAERERALENEFFYEVDKKLLANLRKRLSGEEMKKAFAVVGHFDDARLVDELIELGVQPASLAAVNLIPLILVAWSNHQVPEIERLTVLEAAADEGIHEQSPAYCLLERWLRAEPDQKLGRVWEHYIRALTETLTPDAAASLKTEVMSRARAVAKSAHGILGFGHLAAEEKRTLDQLEDVFSAT
jgi:hypothetical protein